MKIYFPFLPCLFSPIVLSLLSFSQVGVTSLVEVTAGAQTRISVRSVSAQFYLFPFPPSSQHDSIPSQHEAQAHANSDLCSSLFACLPQ